MGMRATLVFPLTRRALLGLRPVMVLTAALTLTGLILAGAPIPAAAQYYYLPDLPVFWGPYPPRYFEYDVGPGPYAARPAPNWYRPGLRLRTRYASAATEAINRTAAQLGLHVLAPLRRKGNVVLCAAADANGVRQHLVFDVRTGKLLERRALNEAGKDKTGRQRKLMPAETRPAPRPPIQPAAEPDAAAPAEMAKPVIPETAKPVIPEAVEPVKPVNQPPSAPQPQPPADQPPSAPQPPADLPPAASQRAAPPPSPVKA